MAAFNCDLNSVERGSDEEPGSSNLYPKDSTEDPKHDAENSLQRQLWDVIRSVLREKSALVQTLTVEESCEQHSSRVGQDFKLKLINEMNISYWHSSAVVGLLNHLVSNKTDFNLVTVFEDGPSGTYDHNLFLEFRFIWQETGFACSVLENGLNFREKLQDLSGVTDEEVPVDHRESLDLLKLPTIKEYYLTSEKRPDLCVVLDGYRILLEGKKPDSFITTWSYLGNENDPSSIHHNAEKPLTVFAFKLKGENSDAARCLGAASKTNVGLMEADMPDPARVIPTKTDNRFFYHSTIRGFSTFESTQFENHFLAVNDSDGSPCLYLKEITKDHEFHREILFTKTAKNN